MKLFAKFLLAALVLGLLLPFTILKDDQGKTLMSFSDLSMPDMPSFDAGSKLVPDSSGLGSTVDFYKWYDAEGKVQFTTQPPPDGIEYTVKGYDPNVNVIQSVKVPEAEPAGTGETTATSESTGAQPGLANTYDADAIKKMFEDTKNIEKLLNQRYQNQNSTINQ